MKIIVLTDSTDVQLLVTTKKLFRTIFDNVIVKQIPMKRINAANWYENNQPYTSKMVTYEPSQYDEGWNACVDYLLSDDESE